MIGNDFVAEAEAAEAQGDYVQALQKWREAKTTRATPYVLLKFGSTALRLKELELAEEAFLEAARIAPKLPVVHVFLGRLRVKQGLFENAVRHLHKALSLKQTAAAYLFLGIAYSEQGDEENAVASFESALALEPADEEVMYNLAIALRPRDPDRSLDLLRKCIAIDPEYAFGHRELRFELLKREHLPEAEKHLKRALTLRPSDVWTLLYLAHLYLLNRRFAAADEVLTAAAALAPDWSVVWFFRGQLYEFTGKPLLSDQCRHRALELEPADWRQNLQYARFLERVGKGKLAAIYAKRVLRQNPGHPAAEAIVGKSRPRRKRSC